MEARSLVSGAVVEHRLLRGNWKSHRQSISVIETALSVATSTSLQACSCFGRNRMFWRGFIFVKLLAFLHVENEKPNRHAVLCT
jgi:hypothetical protein